LGEKAALTPAPAATAELSIALDVAGLFGALTAGTGARLAPALVSQAWQTPAMDASRPILVFKGSTPSAPSVFATALLPGAKLTLAPVDEELAKRGLRAIEGSGCAVREGGPGGSLILCGPREALLAFAPTAALPPAALPGAAISLISMTLVRSLADGLYDLRSAVPRHIDPLFTANSALTQAPALRLAAHDIGFELVERLIAGYEGLGPLVVAVTLAPHDKLAYTVTLEPKASSPFARAVEGARPAGVPAAFLELAQGTDSALFMDSAFFAPAWELSARSLGLLAEARAGGLVDELSALPLACGRPGQGLAFAVGHDSPSEAQAEPPWPPEVKEFAPASLPPSNGYTLLGVEDPKGACGKALAALLASHERLSATPHQLAETRYLRSLAADKALPKGTQLVQLGSTAQPVYIGFGQRKGALWIAQASELALLKSTLADLLAPKPRRKTLKARPELAQLGAEPAVLHGFLREDALPWSSASQRDKRSAGKPALGSDDASKRLPFKLARHGAGVRFVGELDVSVMRRAFGKLIADSWGNLGDQRLTSAQRELGLSLLDAACHLGDGSACNWLGVSYGDGRGIPKDEPRALALLQLGCQQRFGTACANIAFYSKPDKAEELRLFQQACELDSAIGCAWWGVRLLDLDEPARQREGLAKLQVGCGGLVGFACARIASHYREGVGLPQDDLKAADFQERACEIGFAFGCVELAEAFFGAKGRARDEARGFALLQKACSTDKASGCFALGGAYLDGRGTPKDEAAAREQFNVACEAEHAEACRALAEMAGEP